MAATILDGEALAADVRTEAAAAGAALFARTGIRPGLATVRVGDHPASAVYVRAKVKRCAEAGFANFEHQLPADTPQAELLVLLDQLNANPAVHGILVQLPLPPQIDEAAVIDAIDPRKDVDAFHPENIGRLATGHPRFLPCTPHGIVQMLQRAGVRTDGKHAVVLGRSNIVGKPLALMLMQKATKANPMGGNATVTVAHTGTRNLADLTRSADILIAAVGVPRRVTADLVKPGAAVIDVGINRVDGKLVGDVDFGPVSEVAGVLTPVPKGVGPMTIAMLLHNTAVAAGAGTRGPNGS